MEAEIIKYQHPPQPQPGGHRPLQPQQHQSRQQAGPCRPQLPDAHAQQHGGKNARRKGQRYGGQGPHPFSPLLAAFRLIIANLTAPGKAFP